ncbi:MAG TPA: homoserine O-acetyltransferase [Thermoanaerobaculia bacterium]|nr:homoserine O-acetyltransferase [Thermoanaerobaculia bacterium]
MPPYERVGESFISEPPKDLVLEEGFRFRHGQTIAPFTIRYETFGTLNEDRSNAILVCHALSASAHAAGVYSRDDERPGWWDGMVGFGKAFDLSRYFVVCVNLPGSCFGTTAPSTIDRESGRPYGSRYPWPTIEDAVESQRIVLDHLGIDRPAAIAGGSLGGMQVLMWAALHPARVGSIVTFAAAGAVPVQGIAWHIIGRKIVESDPAFNGGDYYGNAGPLRGLEVARMVGHMTYLSNEALERKFGRRRRHGTRQFEIDSYFEYQGAKFARQYDANSYIRIQASMDEMDLDEQFGSIEKAFAGWGGPALLVSFDSDWLFPPREVQRVHEAMRAREIDSRYVEIATPSGHDAFLIEFDLITPPVVEFLAKVSSERAPRGRA